MKIPVLTLDDTIGELNAGILAEQLNEAIKKIAYATINNNNDKKIEGKHEGEITLKIKINKLAKDQLLAKSSLSVRIPNISGRGHSTTVYDPEDTEFYTHPGSGYVSVNTINQDDWITAGDPKITHLNQK